MRGQAGAAFPAAAPPEVFDISGAGDTALAALGLALASGAELDEAVELALLASGVAVGKAGTATVTPDELIEAELGRPSRARRGQDRHAASGWSRDAAAAGASGA